MLTAMASKLLHPQTLHQTLESTRKKYSLSGSPFTFSSGSPFSHAAKMIGDKTVDIQLESQGAGVIPSHASLMEFTVSCSPCFEQKRPCQINFY